MSQYWDWLREGKYLVIRGAQWEVTIEARPGHCDRGRYYAKAFYHGPLQVPQNTHGWPRYYFNLDYAMEEVRAWLEARHDLLPESHYYPLSY